MAKTKKKEVTKTKKSKSPTEGSSKGKQKYADANVTPIGRFSFPYLAEPDTEKRGDFKPDNKYKVDLLIDKKVWKDDELVKNLKANCLKEAKKKWGKDVELADLRLPFIDVDKKAAKKGKEDELPKGVKNCVIIRAKTLKKPKVVGPKKDEEFTQEDIEAIKGGDYGRMVVVPATYTLDGNRGINLYLQVVQFQQEGEGFGAGFAKSMELLDDIEVEMDDLEESDDDEEEESEEEETEDSDDEEEEEDSDEDEEESEEEDEEESEESEDEDSDEDESEEEDDEEEEAPRKSKSSGKGRKGSKSTKSSAKAGKKAKKGKKVDDDSDFDI